MHPRQGKVAGGRVVAIIDPGEVLRQELEIGTAELAMREALQVDLQRTMGHGCDQQRHQQAEHLVLDELACSALAYSEEEAGA